MGLFKQYLIETIELIEGKVDDLAAQNPDIPVRDYAAKDPTPTKKFLVWLVKQHKLKNVIPNDPDLESILKGFDQYKHLHGIPDHSRYTYQQIRDVVMPHIGKLLGKAAKQQQNIEGVEKIYQGPDGIEAFWIKTKEASQNLYGGGRERGGELGGFRGTTWCVSARSEACLFERVYGKMYTIHVPGDDRAPYAVHPLNKLITNRYNDGDISIDKFLQSNIHLKSAINKILEHYNKDNLLIEKFDKDPDKITDDDMYFALNNTNKKLASRAMQHPKMNSVLLYQALKNINPYIRIEALDNDYINKNHLMLASKDSDANVRSSVADHKDADDDVLKKLMQDSVPKVRQKVVSKINLAYLNDMLQKEKELHVWESAVDNKNFNSTHAKIVLNKYPKFLEKLILNSKFRQILESQNMLSSEIISSLIDTRDPIIIYCLSLNPNLSSINIKKILSYKTLNYEPPEYETSKYNPRQFKLNVINSAKNITLVHLKIALDDSDTYVQQAALKHPKMTKGLRQYYNDKTLKDPNYLSAIFNYKQYENLITSTHIEYALGYAWGSTKLDALLFAQNHNMLTANILKKIILDSELTFKILNLKSLGDQKYKSLQSLTFIKLVLEYGDTVNKIDALKVATNKKMLSSDMILKAITDPTDDVKVMAVIHAKAANIITPELRQQIEKARLSDGSSLAVALG